MKFFLILIIIGSINCFAKDSSYPMGYNNILIDTIKESIQQADSDEFIISSNIDAYNRKDIFKNIMSDTSKIDIKIPLIWYSESF